MLLLLAIADNADDEGYCWPGIEYLAAKIKMTPQSVIRLTKELEESQELFVVRSRRLGNKYVVRLGMTNGELTAILISKFGFDDETITNILLYNTCVNSEVTPDVNSEVTPMLDESSVTVIELSHGADAPTQPSQPEAVGEELVEEYFGTKPERESIPETPHWIERIAEDWTRWGAESQEMQHQLAAFGERGRNVQCLGYKIEKQFGLKPLWDKPKDVNRWTTGLAICLDLAEGDEKIVIQAARTLIKDGMTVSDPWSLHKKTRAIVAEERREVTVDREFIV